MSEGRLKDRIILITGASRGIGCAVAKRFAQEGAHVVATARTVGGLEELDDAIRARGGTCTLVPLDLRDGEALDGLGCSLYKRFKRLDGLVGNAGLLGELSPLSHIDPKVWEKTFAVNVTANFRLIRSLEPLLRQSEAGRAVFVSSKAVLSRKPYWSLYTASKAALEAMVVGWAGELRQTNMRANVIQPGGIATTMRAQAFPGENPATLPQPEEVTELFVELCGAMCDRNGEIVKL